MQVQEEGELPRDGSSHSNVFILQALNPVIFWGREFATICKKLGAVKAPKDFFGEKSTKLAIFQGRNLSICHIQTLPSSLLLEHKEIPKIWNSLYDFQPNLSRPCRSWSTNLPHQKNKNTPGPIIMENRTGWGGVG